MGKIRLTLSCWDYDRTRALQDGRVEVEGVDLTYLPLRVEETFWRMLRYGEFDVAEMSTGSFLMSRDKGAPRLDRYSSLSVQDFSPLVHLHQYRFRHQKTGGHGGQKSRRTRISDHHGDLGARHLAA